MVVVMIVKTNVLMVILSITNCYACRRPVSAATGALTATAAGGGGRGGAAAKDPAVAVDAAAGGGV